MTEKEIADALRFHLAGTPFAAPILWENAPGIWNGAKYAQPVPPFWAVSMVKTPPERFDLANAHILRGRMVVSVMAKEGDAGDAVNGTPGFAYTAETHAERIVERFASQRLIDAGDGQIMVDDLPYSDEGYRDGAYWRVNVQIRWQAVKE